MNKEVSKALIKRFISSVITLFFLVSFLFIITRLSPGDPTQKFISAEFSPDLAQKISESFNLNKPITEQYFSFVGNLFKGDLGTSYNYHHTCTFSHLAVFTIHINFRSNKFFNSDSIKYVSCTLDCKEKKSCSG